MTDRAAATNQPVSLADEERVKQVLVESVLGLPEVVNKLARLQPSRRERHRVSIVGSAHVQRGHFAQAGIQRVAAALAAMDCDIVAGGGPGLMQAANEGAATATTGRARSVGIRVDLPFEQHADAFVTQAFGHRTFFTRLHRLVLPSDAFAVAPGGIGTVLESMTIWQLRQVHHLRDTPLIVVGGMWHGLIEWAREAVLATAPPLASAPGFDIPQCVDDADAAIALVRAHHER